MIGQISHMLEDCVYMLGIVESVRTFIYTLAIWTINVSP